MGKLELQNISFLYEKRKILDGINFHLTGGIVGIIGQNGTGKTTLFKIICGLLKPLTGNVFIKDKNINFLSKRDVAQNVSLLPQINPIPWGWTVKEIITFGRYPFNYENLELVDYYLDFFEISKFSKKRSEQLSGGELQKVYLARTFVQNTDIILLDEPSNSLDLESKKKFVRIKEKVLNNQKLLIIISHDRDVIKNCELIYKLNNTELNIV